MDDPGLTRHRWPLAELRGHGGVASPLDDLACADLVQAPTRFRSSTAVTRERPLVADTGSSRRASQADLGRTVTSRPKGCFQALPRTITLGHQPTLAVAA